MQITKVKVCDLHLDPSNARLHSTKNLDAIKASLLKFGQQKPIVLDKQNVVIAGNGTLLAAKELGWSEINAVKSELGKTEAIAYAVADNRTTDLSTWDMGVLGDTLQALREEDWDLGDLGFDDLDELKMFPMDDAFDNDGEDKSGKESAAKYMLEIEFADEQAMKDEYEKLLEQGLIVRCKNG